MKKSERIEYTVTGFNFSEISRGKGSIEYQLMDEFGNERTVTAMAKLNIFNKINSIKPIYHRELPLITALAQTKLNDSVIVDFSEFNKQYPRGSMRKQKVTIPTVKVSHSQGNQINGLSSLADNKMRLFKILFISIAGFVICAYLLSKIPSPFS